MEKSADAFRTISEVAEDLGLPQHVLRFWESRFPQIRPLKRAGGRRYYRPVDVVLLRTIRRLLYDEGYTIKGVQRLLKEQGAKGLREAVPGPIDLADADIDTEGLASNADCADAPVDETVTVAATPSDPVPRRRLAATPEDRPLDLKDHGILREALAVVEDCARVLNALRRPRG